MSARDRSSNRRYFSPVVLRLAELRWDTKSIPVEGHRVRTSTTAGVREIGSQFGRNEILHGRGHFCAAPTSKDRAGSWPPLFEFARYRISYASNNASSPPLYIAMHFTRG